MKTVIVPIERIQTNGGTQTRVEVDAETVHAYAALLLAGKHLPPVVVFDDGINLWLADGFHRYYAHVEAGCSDIEVEVRDGSCEDAVWYACGSNATHGLRRSSGDKRNAVKKIMENPKWKDMSDRAIADHCSVGYTLVADVRKRMYPAVQVPVRAPEEGQVPVQEPDPPVPLSGETATEREYREGRDGKAYPVPPPKPRADSQPAPLGEGYHKRLHAGTLCPPCAKNGMTPRCLACETLLDRAAEKERARQEARERTMREKATAKAAGTKVFDWVGFEADLGLVKQAPKLIAEAIPEVVDSPQYHGAVRLLDEFAAHMKTWRRQLQKPQK